MKTICSTILCLLLLASCSGERKERKEIARVAGEEMHRLAVDAAVWGVPIVSMYALREAFFRDAHARYGDIVYWSRPADWQLQVATASPNLRYAYFNFNCKEGPVVIEIPRTAGTGFFGSIFDAWRVPVSSLGVVGVDSGRGGKFLLVPPGYKGEVSAGYNHVRLPTCNGYALLRVLPDDGSENAAQRAIALIKQVRTYPLSKAADPPAPYFIDMSGKLFDAVVHFDAAYYEALANILNEESALPRDTGMVASLRKLGIIKGVPFKPDAPTRKLLAIGAENARGVLMRRIALDGPLLYLDGHWRTPSAVGSQTGFSFEVNRQLDIGARGASYFFSFDSLRFFHSINLIWGV